MFLSQIYSGFISMAKRNYLLLKKILSTLKPHRKLVIWAIFLMFCSGALAQLNPLIFKRVLDGVVEIIEQPSETREYLPFLATLIGLLIIKEIIFQALNIYIGYTGEKIKVTAATEMSNAVSRHLATLDIEFFDKKGNSPGEIVKRIDMGVEGMSKVVKNVVIDILPLIFTAVLAIIIMFFSNWKVGILSLIIVPFFFVASLRQAQINKGTRIKIEQSKEDRSKMLTIFIDSIKLIKSYLMEKHETDKISGLNEELFLNETKHHYINKKYEGIKGFFEHIGEVAILGLTSYLVIVGEMTTGAILLHLLLYRNITAPVTHLHRIFDEFQEAADYSEGYFALLDEKPTVGESQNPRKVDQINGHILLENVCFAYPHEPDKKDNPPGNEKRFRLKSISLELNPGFLYAIVGQNGAGKTTIVNLIMRFYDPQEGAILLDGIDIKELSKSDLRDAIGIVLQEHHFVLGTIRENLRYGKLNASNDEMVEALDLVRLKEDLGTEALNLEARKLSKGQKQRLAIARVILKNPRILILDEPTAAIDPIAVKEIDSVVSNVMKDRTTLVISHNMSSILKADRIFVMKDGELVQEGRHEELYSVKGHYRTIMKAWIESLCLDKLSNSR